MEIKVIFSAEVNPDFMSKQIMNKFKTPYSHVLIQHEEGKIFHAVGKGVCVEDADPFFKDHIAVATFLVKLDVSRDFFYGFVMGANGKEYSQSQIAALASGKGTENGDEKMICSELVGIILTKMGKYKISGHQDSWTPLDCHKVLEKGL